MHQKKPAHTLTSLFTPLRHFIEKRRSLFLFIVITFVVSVVITFIISFIYIKFNGGTVYPSDLPSAALQTGQIINSQVDLDSFLNQISQVDEAVPPNPESDQIIGLTIAPAIIEQVIQPGQIATASVTVRNISAQATPITSVAQRMVAKNINNTASENSAQFDSSEWIQIIPTDFILDPQEAQRVEIIFRAPEKAEPGGHYSMVYFQPLSYLENQQGVTQTGARLGALNMILVTGETVESARIQNFSTQKIRHNGPIEFELGIANDGNRHTIPTGHITIKDFTGRPIHREAIEPYLLLPKTAQVIKVAWDKFYLFGKYTAQASVIYSADTNSTLTQEIEFWVIPIGIVIPITIPLTLLLISIILNRNQITKAVYILVKGSQSK